MEHDRKQRCEETRFGDVKPIAEILPDVLNRYAVDSQESFVENGCSSDEEPTSRFDHSHGSLFKEEVSCSF